MHAGYLIQQRVLYQYWLFKNHWELQSGLNKNPGRGKMNIKNAGQKTDNPCWISVMN